MKYSFWTLQDGALLIEKYQGSISKKEIIENDNDLYENANPDCETLLCITDISEAT